jgi:hypothetical protein
VWSPRVRQRIALDSPELADGWRTEANGEAVLELVLAGGRIAVRSQPIGVGGAAGGKFGGRPGGRLELARVAAITAKAIGRGLDWLVTQQREDGSSGSEEMPSAASPAAACLALIADGNTVRSGPQCFALRRGIFALAERRTDDSGRVAPASVEAPLAEQALVAQALVEAFGLGQFAPLESVAKESVSALVGLLADGDAVADAGDPAARGHAAFALVAAREFGALADDAPLVRLAAELAASKATEPAAVALSVLSPLVWASGSPPAGAAKLAALAKLAPRARTPFDAGESYFGALAASQVGGPTWETWSKALAAAAVPAQDTKSGAWVPRGFAGERDRVWTTALATLALQSCCRYAAKVGAGR